MKTLKVMSIISLVFSGISFLCLVGYDNYYQYEIAIGWGILLAFWTIAYSIVGLVQSRKK